MSRIRYRKVSDETGEEVPDENIVKGYEVSKGRYVVVDPDELEPFIPAATKTVDLEEFVDLADIDPVYFESAYYVAPGANPKPYVLLARAMEESGKVAIGRFVMRNKQYTAAIRAIRPWCRTWRRCSRSRVRWKAPPWASASARRSA